MRRTSFLVTVLVTLLVALGGAPILADAEDDAAAAFKRQLRYFSDGQFGRLYTFLHPAQKGLVAKADYLRCAENLPAIDVLRIRVLDTYREKVDIPGTDLVVKSIAITARITARGPVGEESDTDTSHVVKVGKTWRWVLNDADGFANGGCPADYGGSPSPPTTTPAPGGVTITLSEFDQLQPGMTYERVVAIVGGEGTVQSQYESGSFNSISYEWKGEDEFSTALVSFQDGGLNSKNQFGLE